MSKEIFELLRADNMIYVNRTLAMSIGLNEAIIFGILLAKEHYFRGTGQLDEEGMFYSTASDIRERTTLTQRQQEKAIHHLESIKFISTKLKGMPAKKYYMINPNTQHVLKFMRMKTKDKPDGKNNGSDGGNESGDDTIENYGETSIDKMLNQGSTEQLNLFQQNVDTSLDEKLKHDSIKSERMVSSNGETININKNNNKIYINNNSARESDNCGNDFDGIINNFTNNETVKTALTEYIKMRLKRPKTATTGYTLSLILKRLAELSNDPETQVKILEQSIINSYPDLYELKKVGEYNDYRGKSANNRGIDKNDLTGLAGGKNNGRLEFPGVVKLGKLD